MMIPHFLYNNSLLNKIDDLIDDGYDCFDDLSTADKDNVIAICIEILGEDAYICLIDNNLSEMISLFKHFIISRASEDSINLSEIMLKNAKIYFSCFLNQLFQERVNRFTYERNIEHGIFPFKEMATGEIEWRKSA